MTPSFSRRHLLQLSGAGVLASAAQMPMAAAQPAPEDGALDDWRAVRNLFPLSGDAVHMSAMLLASHPAPVAQAIERHRQGHDAEPVRYLEDHDERLTTAVREAAARYLGTHRSHIALTDSTTMSVGLVYAGLRLGPGDEVLTTAQDYFVTHESLRLAALKSGASVRQISLFDDSREASADAMVERIVAAVRPETRLVALTWVHSSTGTKIPAAQIGAALEEINAGRGEGEQILFGLDAVHGFGVEPARLDALGCDFFMAGCHKWLFGPRGTGIIAVSSRGLGRLRPLIPSFDDPLVISRWITGDETPDGRNNGLRLTPGGFKAFEHRWAMTEAFELHERIGPERVTARTRQLAGRLKAALAAIPQVTVRTPMDEALSAGIVSFDVAGQSPRQVMGRLRERGIIASVAPYARPHVRLTPSIVNDPDEVDAAAAALQAIV